MFEDSKTVFITHPYYAVNNPTNNFRIYRKEKHTNKWTYIQCKSKEEYRTKVKEYILGFFDYGRNEKKAYTSAEDYIESDSGFSMFDYFMGGKKEEIVMKKNKMKREEMAMLKNGSYLLDEDLPSVKKRWANYIENSNIQLTVLSFYQNYIDANINVKDLQKKIAVDIMPKFLSYCGYEEPRKNLEWIVALHADRDNNYHFHISWIEKNKCYKNHKNELGHRIKLKLSDKENNFLKRQTTLTIERNLLYKPALIKFNKDIENLKKYFNPNDINFTLKNINDIELEEKIVELGLLLNQVRNTNKKYIKYNSIPKTETGNRIRKLTKEIKKELFKNDEIKAAKKQIKNSIDVINNILIDIDKRNNISDVGFETALENKLIQQKISKNETYILNAIANHALYNFYTNDNRIKKNAFCLEDIITQVAYQCYEDDYKIYKNQPIKKFRNKLLNNFFRGKRYKNKTIYTLEKLKREQDRIAEDFYKMFDEESTKELNNY